MVNHVLLTCTRQVPRNNMEYYSTAYEKSMETCLITTYVL